MIFEIDSQYKTRLIRPSIDSGVNFRMSIIIKQSNNISMKVDTERNGMSFHSPSIFEKMLAQNLLGEKVQNTMISRPN